MTPKMSPSFENRVRTKLATLLTDVGAQIVVDSVMTAPKASTNKVLLVDFHLEGAWSSPAQFTFPFHQSRPIERSASALRDMVSKNWKGAHLAPPSASRPRASGAI
jgi:hypothetical protein